MTDTAALELPKIPSQLLRLAVAEARDIDRDIYSPDANKWHNPIRDRDGCFVKCEVCFAGAVLAGRFKIDPHVIAHPSDVVHVGVSYETYTALHALDNFRVGDYHLALQRIGLPREVVFDIAPTLPKLAQYQFKTWDQFDAFLDSIDPLTVALEGFDL